MVRKVVAVLFVVAVLVSGSTAAVPEPSKGEIFDKGSFDDKYTFRDTECGFPFRVRGRSYGYFVTRTVPGSDGQAFLADNHYTFREILTNPANQKRMKVWGIGHFKERSARHVRGDIWEFVATDTGMPFVVEDSAGKIVLKDRGRITLRAVFDTLGDSEPGGEVIEEEVVDIRGHFPSYDEDFDFCALASRLIG